jgi:type I site-specific restriction endonuclease
MNEAETRAELIDPALRGAGWGVIEASRIRREIIAPGRILGHGRRGEQLKCDYVLTYRNAKLAVVEANSDDTLVEGEIDEGRRYTEEDFNRLIEIEARERFRVKIFMDAIDQRQKTLVFCATQAHALAVPNLINQMRQSADPHFCERVTANDGATGDQYLKQFQNNEKTIPTILTTSQKLSTGVDARNVRNIVLMRPVKSMIELKQIIGRGTRLFDGKDYFTILDFVKAYEHFNDPEWDGEPLSRRIGLRRPLSRPGSTI